MSELFLHTFKDSLQMVPFLLVIYCGVEWLERRFGDVINKRIQQAEKTGPAIGALFGCVPQCGFSVFASAMYTRRLITLGTLMAVYLSTSDEAIPIMLSRPDSARLVIPIILIKVAIAIVAGYSLDFLLKYPKKRTDGGQAAMHSIHEDGCCKHSLYEDTTKWRWFIHPLMHTAKVFAFVFLVSLGIHYLIDTIGEASFARLLLPHSFLQPILAALIGLIPNCAASVAITQVFLEGGIGLGSVIAGLSAGAGLGTLVLIRDNKSFRDTLRVLGLLTGISMAAGIVVQYIWY
ncbi:MAG: putative manganese transporter [Armatimonadota bacterium]